MILNCPDNLLLKAKIKYYEKNTLHLYFYMDEHIYVRACLKFILCWKSIVGGSGELKINEFSELNEFFFRKSGS